MPEVGERDPHVTEVLDAVPEYVAMLLGERHNRPENRSDATDILDDWRSLVHTGEDGSSWAPHTTLNDSKNLVSVA